MGVFLVGRPMLPAHQRRKQWRLGHRLKRGHQAERDRSCEVRSTVASRVGSRAWSPPPRRSQHQAAGWRPVLVILGVQQMPAQDAEPDVGHGAGASRPAANPYRHRSRLRSPLFRRAASQSLSAWRFGIRKRRSDFTRSSPDACRSRIFIGSPLHRVDADRPSSPPKG